LSTGDHSSKVLDLTSDERAGPTAVRGWPTGARKVLDQDRARRPRAIEQGDVAASRRGPRHGFDFQNLHRNKRVDRRSNLKAAAGRRSSRSSRTMPTWSSRTMRADVKFRLGVDYETRAQDQPAHRLRLDLGLRPGRALRDRAGVDQIAQGMGGLMSITGEPGQGPVRVGIPIADLTAGILLALAVMMALLEREKSGEGQWVHTSLLEAQIAMLDFQASRWLMAGEVPKQAGNDHPTSIPTGVFPTSDGHINIAASGAAPLGPLLRGHRRRNGRTSPTTRPARTARRTARR
jgi:hypothetical protein